MGRLKGRKVLCTREETVTRHQEHSKGHMLGKNGNQDGWGCLSMFSQLKLRVHVVKNGCVKVKEESEKAGLKLNIQKTKIMASGPITSCK